MHDNDPKPPLNPLLAHRPHIGARMAHDEFFEKTIIAQALLWVSLHFNDFMRELAEGTPLDTADALQDINQQTFDTWVYPYVERAATQVRKARHEDGPQISMGMMPLDAEQLDDVLTKLLNRGK